ncbi:MAG TPA: UDP-N-acetylglucosamine diphosphorylase [Clostridiales bacterium]|nr:UDP-N-acetylglucosamine diphosphorylase [Clostridiales bacterium]
MKKQEKITIEDFKAECAQMREQRLIILLEHVHNGVAFVDPESTYIDDAVTIGQGTIVYPGVILSGKTVVGQDCTIGANTRIVDSIIGNGVEIQASHIVESQIGNECKIGPFAYLRPDSRIGDNVKIGDFVEIKNSVIGDGTKVPHLTYVGDADLGQNINLGCGVVFVNYDGSTKHRSIVEDRAFIGCNTNLISPVTVGEKAYVAAGSTLTKDVPAGALAVARARQENVAGWVEKRGLLEKKKK